MKASEVLIQIEIENPRTQNMVTRVVTCSQYVAAKTASLKQFGYANLTEDTVAKALDSVLNGKDGKTDIIAQFIASDKPTLVRKKKT